MTMSHDTVGLSDTLVLSAGVTTDYVGALLAKAE